MQNRVRIDGECFRRERHFDAVGTSDVDECAAKAVDLRREGRCVMGWYEGVLGRTGRTGRNASCAVGGREPRQIRPPNDEFVVSAVALLIANIEGDLDLGE